ncbi:MAG: hypothetical protein PHR96_02480 [Clostridia bacterium]|nr:hypothetical protein [Clostridia bacterium]
MERLKLKNFSANKNFFWQAPGRVLAPDFGLLSQNPIMPAIVV